MQAPRRLLDRMRLRIMDVLVLLLLAACVFLYLTPSVFEPAPRGFDAAAWRADDSGCSFYSSHPRQRMAEDLRRLLADRSPPPGMKDIEALLGPADDAHGPLWRYRAGTSTLDCLSFDIAFDGGGRYVSARLVQH